MHFKILQVRFIHHTLNPVHWPEKAVLCCWCHRPGECCAHPQQQAYCGRHSCPSTALTLTASAAWWETGCQQISSGSTSQKQWPAEWSQNTAAVLMQVKSSCNKCKHNQFPLCSNSWTTGLWHGCHFKCYLMWEYIFSKYSQLHSLNLLVGPLCLEDHQSLWCSELETPSPILFPWHWWRTCTGASSPAQEQSGKGETTVTYNTCNTDWFGITKLSRFYFCTALIPPFTFI